MFRPNKQQKIFLEKNVYAPLGIKEITPENIDEAYDFIVEHFEVPYVQSGIADSSEDMIFIMELLDDMSKHMDWA